MIDKQLIDMLICPETGQRLRRAEHDTRAKINSLIEKGEITDSAGNLVTETADDFLETEDRSRVYGVKNGIPVLLASKSIPSV